MPPKRSDSLIHKKSHVLIATFSPWKNGIRLPINGNVEPMRDYFVPRVERVVLIDQVYPGSDFVMPRIEIYTNGKLFGVTRTHIAVYILYPLLLLANKSGTQPPFKVRDFLSVCIEGIRAKNPFDICIGFEAINALAGVLLRRMGKVRRVIYYVSDYSPNRYVTGWFNQIYLWLDRQAAMHADVIWDVSKAIMPARIQAGLDPASAAPVLHVPNALYATQIKVLPPSELKKNTLIFLGTLGYENGPDIAIEATALAAIKIPSLVLHIIGGNEPNEVRLKKLARDLGITKRVVFHGFINDREKVSALARTFQLALAPYKDIKGSARRYGDATKIRAYAAAGLPVITTDVPPLGKDVRDAGAGMITGDNPAAFAKAIVSVLNNPILYASMRSSAIRFAKENTWENEFDRACRI